MSRTFAITLNNKEYIVNVREISENTEDTVVNETVPSVDEISSDIKVEESVENSEEIVSEDISEETNVEEGTNSDVSTEESEVKEE